VAQLIKDYGSCLTRFSSHKGTLVKSAYPSLAASKLMLKVIVISTTCDRGLWSGRDQQIAHSPLRHVAAYDVLF